jgi:hypothetical protein
MQCDRGRWFMGYIFVVHSVTGHTGYPHYMLLRSVNTDGDCHTELLWFFWNVFLNFGQKCIQNIFKLKGKFPAVFCV